MEQDELIRLEDRCIQEHPAACVAACPIHVNARAMAAAVAKGDVAAAAAIFRKSVPFPGIIARICDHPCQAVCKRGEAGAPIAIRELEQACLAWAPDAGGVPPALPRKENRVAVAGGGLSGLTAAFDLAKKGYGVVVFEKSDRLGGSLWQFSTETLPWDVLAADFKVLESLGIEVRFNAAVGEAHPLSTLCKGFDAVYLAMGKGFGFPLGLGLDAAGRIAADPVTFATDREGVFAGGGMIRTPEAQSPIGSMADGRRAAISIDRFLQHVSLTASRTGEGSVKTRLYTKTEGIPALPAVSMANPAKGYSAEEAVREAQRCIQCECLECVKVCAYLNRFHAYPKRYIRQIYNNLSIVMGHRTANTLINSCSLCGLCQEVCPEDLHMGEVCKTARKILVDQGKMPPSAHDFALRDMAFSNGETCALAHHAPGTETSRYLFFPGCQLSGSSPEQVKKTYALLRERLSGGVGFMLGCCGAPADWSGRSALFDDTLERFATQWEGMGRPQVIAACSTCREIFKTHGGQENILSLWEVFDRLGLPETAPAGMPKTVAVHDPCTTRHDPKIHAGVRNILSRMGVAVEELPLNRDRTECCGYGGLMFFANPELAKEVIDRRIAASPADYLAYCAMCRDYLASRGKRTVHLLDLMFGAPGAADRRGPGYTDRHENRARLKRAMLKELWGETVEEETPYGAITLVVAEGLRETLEARQILDEDIERVIDTAERTGNKLFNRKTGRFLAHLKPTRVTYWVDYTPLPDGTFAVHNAYSHRMEIVEDATS